MGGSELIVNSGQLFGVLEEFGWLPCIRKKQIVKETSTSTGIECDFVSPSSQGFVWNFEVLSNSQILNQNGSVIP